jgi:hypothetical protein
MEAMAVTASLIDRAWDYMLETAMLKSYHRSPVGSGQRRVPDPWRVRHFTTSPLERCCRRAINQIGEAATKAHVVHRAGLNARAGHGVQGNLRCSTFSRGLGKVDGGMNRPGAAVKIPGAGEERESSHLCVAMGCLIWRFNLSVNKALIAPRAVADMQLVQNGSRVWPWRCSLA